MQPALLLVLLALLVVTGCGAGEVEQEAALPQPLATELAARSDAVAEQLDAGDACAALAEAEALQQQTIAAVNAGRVPPRFQEELTAAVGSLVASIECAPAAPAPTRTEEEDEEDGDGGDDGDDADDDDDSDSDDSEDDKRGPGEGAGKGNGNKGKRGRG